MSIAPEVATHTGEAIETLLKQHGVKVKYVTDFKGPTIIQHAFALEAGTAVRKVEALSRDIAVALGLEDVRIVAPIPGTAFVGVEVPRTPRETVTYADFVCDEDQLGVFEDYALPIPIGVGIGGTSIWADLTKLPHLLVAGTTGSGKSVAVSSAITALLDNRGPDDLRVWLIDPKRVELGMFADAPQVERVATDVQDALEVLEDVVEIMDSRYEAFEEAGVRNIVEYNGEVLGYHRMPYHVVVIDELADLMMTAKKEVEGHIVRIAQLARAAGIHLILATQRPTVDVVTGLISTNVPSRWTFAVRSVKDSMVALDQTGAQALYGQGDSLWLPAGADKPVRVQAVYTDDETIANVVADANVSDPADAETLCEWRSSASPRAAESDDDLTLEDLGVPVEDLGGLEIEEENHEAIVMHERFEEVHPIEVDQALMTYDGFGAPTVPGPMLFEEPKHRAPIDEEVDLMRDSNLEDPDRYNMVAELADTIQAMVAHEVGQIERARFDQKQARLDRLDRAWRRYALRPFLWVAGGTAALWILGRIVGA